MLLASATIEIDADQASVFDLFTTETGLCRWMAKEASIDLRPGGALRWVHDDGVAAAGEYVDVDPFVNAHEGGRTYFLGQLAEVAAGAELHGDRLPTPPNQEE
jgi:hypothetical protein